MEVTLETKIKLIKTWLGSGSINIFGLPFSGKDTHGGELSLFFDAVTVSSGDILRSDSPKHIRQHLNKGNLVPTDAFLEIVLPYLSQTELAGKPLILSSVGRWHGEEDSVITAADKSGHPIKAVVYLVIDEKEAEHRRQSAERNREDDVTHSILLNRFSEFKAKTLPVIDYYRDKDLLIEVDGMPAKKIVTSDIIEKLAELAEKDRS